IPDHDRARAVVSFGNDSFKVEVGDRMIFDLHGQTFVGGIERWPLRHRPGLQHAFHLQPEIRVQASNAMAVHAEAMALALVELRRGFGGFRKAPLALIFFECHRNILSGVGASGDRVIFYRYPGFPVLGGFDRPITGFGHAALPTAMLWTVEASTL